MGSSTANVKTYYKGQNIFKEGQESNVAYMIKKGAVNVYKIMDNKKVVLGKLKEGEIFGEMGILTKSPRTANTEAAEFCELLVLTDQLLYNLLNQCPKTIQHLTRLLIKRLERTDTMIPARAHQNAFTSVCRIFSLVYENHMNIPAADAKNVENYDLGLSYTKLSKAIKDIILVTQVEIDEIFIKLEKLNIISSTSLKAGKAFSEKYVKMTDPESFAQVTANLVKELQDTSFGMENELEYVDIFEFSSHVHADPEVVYKKMGQGEIPESLFFFSKSHTYSWADDQGRDFFQKVSKKKKNLEDFEDVNDIVYMDNATIKEALARLGYYKIGVLLAVAEDDAKAKITGNLSKKIAKVVQEEAANKHVDQTEAEDIQEELIAMFKELKGAA